MQSSTKLFSVAVAPRAKQNKVVQIDTTHLKVWVTITPEHGKANAAVIKLLARFFDVPQSRITIKRGITSSTKLVVVE